MKILFISDTHGKHHKLSVPEADLLIHAGDLSSRGTQEELRSFLDWFSALPHRHKVFVGGNHDFLLERQPGVFLEMVPANCIYLFNSSTEIEGIRIWGSPLTPWFFDWAFNRRRGGDIRRYWDRIPAGTDILVTHGPPAGILGKTARGDRAGCEDLLAVVQQIRPKIHVFGHIHEAYGQLRQDGTHFINASNLDLRYQVAHAPVGVEWDSYQK